jgi:hypothetical protein
MAEQRRVGSRAREHVEDMLDEALQQTFPASDPVTLKSCVDSPGDPAGEKAIDPAACDAVPRGTGPDDGRTPPRAPAASRRRAR